MKLKELGEVQERLCHVRVCGKCDCVIENSTSMCSHGCPLDGSLARPREETILRTWKRIEILINQEFV